MNISCGVERSVSTVRWAADIRSCGAHTRISRFRSVDVSVGVNPHNTGIGVNSEGTRLGGELVKGCTHSKVPPIVPIA